jgi:FKBP-type peptidyl-prolyl cis-trans isomerase
MDISKFHPPDQEEEPAAEALGESAAQAADAANVRPVNTADSPPTEKGETVTTKSGLKYTTVRPGTGAPAKSGQTVTVHYTGSLPDGQVFDTSRNKGGTGFSFKLGTGMVIKGWDEGVAGMKVNEVRRLTVPPDLAYGREGRAKIPPNATLLFDVELMKVE